MADHGADKGHHSLEAVTPEPVLTPEQNRAREIEVRVLHALLEEKGLVSDVALDRVLESYRNDIGPLNGSRVVSRAWKDAAYKARLLEDGTSAIAELGYGGLQGEHLVVVENTAAIHNVIVCTLCSCYPWPVLGLPPFWYKSKSYRSRIVSRPREVLREFGLCLDDDVQVEVWNSSYETRYMVLPRAPHDVTHRSEAELAEIVTRDSMIGVSTVTSAMVPSREPARREIGDMSGTSALPRKSGELEFQHPWEGEAFSIAVSLCENGQFRWPEFQKLLIQEIGRADGAATNRVLNYYENWLVALVRLVVLKGACTEELFKTRVRQIQRGISMRRSRLPFGVVPWLRRDEE